MVIHCSEFSGEDFIRDIVGDLCEDFMGDIDGDFSEDFNRVYFIDEINSIKSYNII